MAYRFDDFEIDFQLYELRLNGERVRIDRKVFDLLRYLIEHRERVVSKEELLRAVWHGEAVVDAVVPTAIARLRKALSQASGASGLIETAHGRGYRFVADISTFAQPSESTAERLELDTDLHPGLRDPFVGRDPIMQRLSGAFDKAIAGQMRVRVLLGEPGIGKTRITQELASRARAMSVNVLAGRCHENDRVHPLLTFGQVLGRLVLDGGEALLRKLTPGERRQLSALLPELRSAQLGPEAPELEPDVRLFDAIARLLRASAQEAPLLLIIDDLHWADESSLSLLLYLAEELGDVRLFVVATFRDAELPPDHPHLRLLDRMERCPSFKRIEVPALSASDIEVYVHGFTGRRPPQELATRIRTQTAGNAFFVRETVRSLTWDALREGHLDLSAVVLPESARDVVRRRLSVLPAQVQQVLAVASAIGESFELPLLQRVTGLEPDKLLDALDRALAARLIASDTPRAAASGTYSFAHALLQETIYGDLSSTQRAALHNQIAAALEHDAGMSAGAVTELAFHYHRALPHADGRKVFEYGVRAAERAHSRDEHEDEARWYGCAYDGLRYAKDADAERGAELMLAQGRALRESGRPAEAKEALSRVIELSDHGKASEKWAKEAQDELSRLGDA